MHFRSLILKYDRCSLLYMFIYKKLFWRNVIETLVEGHFEIHRILKSNCFISLNMNQKITRDKTGLYITEDDS